MHLFYSSVSDAADVCGNLQNTEELRILSAYGPTVSVPRTVWSKTGYSFGILSQLILDP